MIGDTETAALIGRDGSIDWLCFLASTQEVASQSCSEITTTATGRSSLTRRLHLTFVDIGADRWCSKPRSQPLPASYRSSTSCLPGIIIRESSGSYGASRAKCRCGSSWSCASSMGYDVPWVRRTDRGLIAIAGPNALVFDSPIELNGLNMRHEGKFTVHAGEDVPFALAWYRSHEEPPFPLDIARALGETMRFWGDWCAGVLPVHGEWEDLALRSLITLKGLTYGPTGGIVAAPTTSLPESLGGVRNWDYRYCWIRDAALTLESLIESGLREEAESWLAWLGRVAAGDPNQLQIMYGPAGERRLTELEVDWLPGYEGSSPVRIGNAASEQFQLDVYGELMDAIDRARNHGIDVHEVVWHIQVAIMRFLVDHWSDPDDGIWEVRGPRRLFTHSKVMTWVAFDRAVRGVEVHGLDGPAEEWRVARDTIHAEVCRKGWNAEVGAFTQFYGAVELDASLLMMPLVGFLSGRRRTSRPDRRDHPKAPDGGRVRPPLRQ